MDLQKFGEHWPVWFVAALFGAYLAFLLFGFGPHRLSWDDGGKLGDSFGLLTSLFNGLAFAGLLIAIKLQRDDLRLQRDELSLQRQELAETRVVMEKQEAQMALQAEAAQRQLFESTFFSLFNMVQHFIEGLRSGTPGLQLNVQQGRDAFGVYLDKLFAHADNAMQRPIERHEAEKLYREWFPGYEHVFRPYVDTLLAVFDFIENSDRPNKDFYFDLVRAALSPREKTLLFYHSLSIPEHERLHVYIHHYALFRHVPALTLTGHSVERATWHFGTAYDMETARFFRQQPTAAATYNPSC